MLEKAGRRPLGDAGRRAEEPAEARRPELPGRAAAVEVAVRRSVRRPAALDGVGAGRGVDHGPAFLAERAQVRPQREPRHGELALGDVAVDRRQAARPPSHGAGPARAAATCSWRSSRWATNASTTSAHVVHHPAVARAEGARRADRRRARGPRLDRYWCRSPSGRPDDDGRAVHHVVTRQQQRVLLDRPAEMVRGVAGGVHRPQGETARVELGHAATSPRRRAGRARSPPPDRSRSPRAPVTAASAAAPGAWSTCVWVTTMARTDPRGAAAAAMASVWAGTSEGPGSTTTGRRARPGRCWCPARSSDPGFGAVSRRTPGATSSTRPGSGTGPTPKSGTAVITGGRVDHGARARGDGASDTAAAEPSGPGAASGPSRLASMDTARTAALKSPQATSPDGSGTGASS